MEHELQNTTLKLDFLIGKAILRSTTCMSMRRGCLHAFFSSAIRLMTTLVSCFMNEPT
jgi:hypothetical protein